MFFDGLIVEATFLGHWSDSWTDMDREYIAALPRVSRCAHTGMHQWHGMPCLFALHVSNVRLSSSLSSHFNSRLPCLLPLLHPLSPHLWGGVPVYLKFMFFSSKPRRPSLAKERGAELALQRAGQGAARHIVGRTIGESLRMTEHAAMHALKVGRCGKQQDSDPWMWCDAYMPVSKEFHDFSGVVITSLGWNSNVWWSFIVGLDMTWLSKAFTILH